MRSTTKAPRTRLLLIEDNIADSLKQTLGEGLDIVEVTNGEAALEQLAHGNRFDAIVYDVSVTRMMGRTFHEILRARSPEQASRVMLMTRGSRGEMGFSRRAGSRWLWKPVEPNELLAALSQVAKSSASAATQRLAPLLDV